MRKTLTFKIDETTKHKPLRLVLSQFLGLSQHEISRLKFVEDGLQVDGKRVYANSRLEVGDVVCCMFPEEETYPQPAFLPTPEILYEDEDILIARKPAGTCSHPSHRHQDDLGSQVQKLLETRGEAFVIRPIGRLDKDVSGCMIYGKTQWSAARLNQQRMDGTLSKTYLALTCGTWEKKEGTMRGKIEKIEGTTKRVYDPSGEDCITNYQVQQEIQQDGHILSVVLFQLETGRTHQIRVSCAGNGHAILGDPLYGDPMEFHRLYLDCYGVQWIQPSTGAKQILQTKIPEDFYKVALGLHENFTWK